MQRIRPTPSSNWHGGGAMRSTLLLGTVIVLVAITSSLYQGSTRPKTYCRSHAGASAVVYAALLHRWPPAGTGLWQFQPGWAVDQPGQDLAGKHVAAHTHPQDELVTVIDGTWYVGVGDRYDPAKLEGYPVGSFVLIPAGLAHFIAAKETAVIVQLSNEESFRTDYVEK